MTKMYFPIEFNNQPLPRKNNEAPDVWELVMADMRKRNEFGKTKYGIGLKANNGRDTLQDAYEEALDLAVYLRTLIEEKRTKEHSKYYYDTERNR